MKLLVGKLTGTIEDETERHDSSSSPRDYSSSLSPTYINLDSSKERTEYGSPAVLKLVVELRTSKELNVVESVVPDAIVKSKVGVSGGGTAESRLVVVSAEWVATAMVVTWKENEQELQEILRNSLSRHTEDSD